MNYVTLADGGGVQVRLWSADPLPAAAWAPLGVAADVLRSALNPAQEAS